MDKEFNKKIELLIEKYNTQLSKYNIHCDLNKRFSSIPVQNRILGHHTVLEISEDAVLTSRENKHYKYAPNRYYAITLHITPVCASKKKKLDCKQYAFLLSKKERLYKGQAPREVIYNYEKIYKSIDKRLLKILAKAQNMQSFSWLSNTLLDTLRYAYCKKYGYIKTIKGKNRTFWLTAWSLILSIPIIACFALLLHF